MSNDGRPLGRHDVPKDEQERLRERLRQAEANGGDMPREAEPLMPEPAPSPLSEEDKARIRAEEEFRAQARAEAEAARTPLTPAEAQKQKAAAEKAARDAKAKETAEKEAARRAALSPQERKKEDARNALGCGFFSVIGILLMIWLFQSCGSGSGSSSVRGPTPISEISEYTIMSVCEGQVRKKLKAPSTAKFPSERKPVYNAGTWTYGDVVDAQNGFGAMIRSSFLCTVTGTTEDDAMVEAMLLE